MNRKNPFIAPLADKGFTMIEIMIVVAVLCVLALIILPKFGEVIRKSNEAATKGHLGSVRSVVSIYYMDNEQNYPPDIAILFRPGGRYTNGSIPPCYTAEHGAQRVIHQFPATSLFNPDDGFWGYLQPDASNPPGDWGRFWIKCTHKDMRGSVWSSY